MKSLPGLAPALAACVFGVVFGFAAPIGLAKDSTTLPSFEMKSLTSGKTLKQTDLAGKVVLMQFWASWCTTCSKGLSQMRDVAKTLDGVMFLPVSVDEDMKSAQEYFNHLPVTFKPIKEASFLDTEAALATKIGVEGPPSTVLVDKKGKVILLIKGHPSDAQVGKIKKLAADAKGAK